MPILPQIIADNRYKRWSTEQLRQQLKTTELHLYELGKRIASINRIQQKSLLRKFKRQLLIYQIGYYFALYEHLYDIYMEKEKQLLIKDRPGMKVLFDEGIVKDIQDVISLREKAKNRPSNPP